jgi:hypothetical protein
MLAQGVGRTHAVCPQFGGSVATPGSLVAKGAPQAKVFRGSELQLRHKAYI